MTNLSTSSALPLFGFVTTARYNKRGPRRFSHTVGYMAVHTHKGVYLGADENGVAVYAMRKGIVSKREQLIPLFPDDISLLALSGVSVDDKRAMHLFQVAALEGHVRDGYRYTDVRRAFHFSSGNIKTAVCDAPDETTHIEAPVVFTNPRHFDMACALLGAANHVLPLGKQPVYVPLG